MLELERRVAGSPSRTRSSSSPARGTPFLPDDSYELARVVGWLLFEQTDVMMTMGGLRFAPALRDASRRTIPRPSGGAGGADEALRVLDEHLRARTFVVGERYTIADIAVYGYAHVAHEAGLDMSTYPAVGRWLARVAEQPGHVNDLAPYPANARPGAGASIYD